MKKIDKQINMEGNRISITSTSVTFLWRIVEKVDELVEEVDKLKRRLERREDG